MQCRWEYKVKSVVLSEIVANMLTIAEKYYVAFISFFLSRWQTYTLLDYFSHVLTFYVQVFIFLLYVDLTFFPFTFIAVSIVLHTHIVLNERIFTSNEMSVFIDEKRVHSIYYVLLTRNERIKERRVHFLVYCTLI